MFYKYKKVHLNQIQNIEKFAIKKPHQFISLDIYQKENMNKIKKYNKLKSIT